MGIFSRFKDQGHQLQDKAQELAQQHGDKIEQGIDKGADVIDQKTGSKHSDKIDAGAEKAKDALGLNQDDAAAQPPAPQPPAPQSDPNAQ